MNQANRIGGFGTLFPTLAALTAPAQEFLTREPAYRRAGLADPGSAAAEGSVRDLRAAPGAGPAGGRSRGSTTACCATSG